MDFSRIVNLLLGGLDSLDALIAEGDRKAAEFPEGAEAWEAEKAAILQIRNNPELRAEIVAKLLEVFNTIKAGRGPVGESQAHHG